MRRNLRLSKIKFPIKTSVFFMILLLVLSSASFVQAQPITSSKDGSWNDASTWVGGVIPTALDDVIINHQVTVDAGTNFTVKSVYIDNGKKLTVSGKLIINGNLTMHTLGDFSIMTDAVVIVKGDADCGNNTVLSLKSYFIVYGNLNIRNGGQSALNFNNAKIYVLGNLTTNNPDFKVCPAYDGTTSNTTACDAGQLDALIINNVDFIVPEIAAFIQPSINIVDYLRPLLASFCSGGSTTLTITVETRKIDLLKWYKDNELLNTIDPPTSATYSATQTGTYYAKYKIGVQWYQTNPVTVINPNPSVTNLSTATTCSETSPSINITASVASSFSWTIGTITGGITGASDSFGSVINQVLINPSHTSTGTVNYIVTPTSTLGSCVGAAFTITVTINPIPLMGSFN